ncbi:MAG: hypothetical protein R2779_04260 [Crocinitomicaceae bacterium]
MVGLIYQKQIKISLKVEANLSIEMGLTPTSEKTINEINNPSKSGSPLRQFALEKLQTDAKKFNGKFPNEYYVEFSKAVVEKSISINGADKGINAAYAMLGVKNLPQAKSVLQVYESIVPNDQNTHIDKVMHFIASAAKQYNYGKTITDGLQYKEKKYFLMKYRVGLVMI